MSQREDPVKEEDRGQSCDSPNTKIYPLAVFSSPRFLYIWSQWLQTTWSFSCSSRHILNTHWVPNTRLTSMNLVPLQSRDAHGHFFSFEDVLIKVASKLLTLGGWRESGAAEAWRLAPLKLHVLSTPVPPPVLTSVIGKFFAFASDIIFFLKKKSMKVSNSKILWLYDSKLV